jgi:hypothetical protein
MSTMSALVSRNKQGDRRLSPSLYKLLLTAHIIVSVGWLGVTLAKVVLGLGAATTGAPDVATTLVVAIGALNVAFPPLAIATIVTGVFLSLGTKWGLLQHYWVVTKLVLTVGVIVTAVQLTDRLARLADPALFGVALTPATLVLTLAAIHLFMLGVATVISVYKPWGKTWFGRRKASSPPPREAARTAAR